MFYIKLFCKTLHRKFPLTRCQLNNASLLTYLLLCYFWGREAHYSDCISNLRSRNSYLGNDMSGNSLIYILSVRHWACRQQIQFLVITVVENTTWMNINSFNHKWELTTFSGYLEMYFHVDLSQPGNHTKYLKQGKTHGVTEQYR